MAGGWGRCISGLRFWPSALGSPCCLEQKISRVLLHSEAYAYIAAICAAALTISTPFSVKLRNGELVRQDRVAWRRGCSLRAAVRPLLSSAGVLGPLQQPQQFKRPGQTACQALGGIPDYPRLSPTGRLGTFLGKFKGWTGATCSAEVISGQRITLATLRHAQPQPLWPWSPRPQ